MSVMRPVIGVSFYGERATWGAWDVDAVVLHRAYITAIEDSGAAAVVIPPVYDEDSVDAVLDRLDGVGHYPMVEAPARFNAALEAGLA
jgi:putative glutamine amidotransferase